MELTLDDAGHVVKHEVLHPSAKLKEELGKRIREWTFPVEKGGTCKVKLVFQLDTHFSEMAPGPMDDGR